MGAAYRDTRADISLADAFVLSGEIEDEPVRLEGSTREVDW